MIDISERISDDESELENKQKLIQHKNEKSFFSGK